MGVSDVNNNDMNENQIRYVEAIKVAVGSLQYKNISVKQTFSDAVSQLYWYYKYLGEKEYLRAATLHIQAYLEMGFSYEENVELFNKVLEELETTRELEFPKRFYASKKISLNRSQVRSMIKKWPASPHQKMKINEVIDDIIHKIQDKEDGIFYYRCAVTGDLYELVISTKEIFFHDIVRGKFYTFED